MYARSSVIRGGGLCALTLSLFYGCGGLNEADYFPSTNAQTDGGIEAGSGRCGDGNLDPGEDCDGTELGGATCDQVLMTTGSTGQVRCTRTCHFDTSRCSGGEGGNGGTGGTGGSGTGGNGTGGRNNGTGGRNNGTGGTNNGGTNPGTGGGTASGGTGGADVACTSDGDCTGNQICCGTSANGTLSSSSCRNRCNQNSFAIECGKAGDCGNGQVCCGTLNANSTAYTGIACAQTCGQNGANEVTLCTQNSECGGGTSCQASRLLSADFRVCR